MENVPEVIRYSIIVPHRGAAEQVSRLIVRTGEIFDALSAPYEMIVVLDGPPSDEIAKIEALLTDGGSLRLLKFDQAEGVGAALNAGLSAARGEVVIAIESSGQYPEDQILRLLDRLARADLVIGRRRRGRLGKLWQETLSFPRRWLLRDDIHDPGCLLWAARCEAVEGLDLSGGMHRFITALVARRGFRTAEVNVCTAPPASWRRYQSGGTHPVDFLSTWWWMRRGRRAVARELTAPRSESSENLTRRIDRPSGAAPSGDSERRRPLVFISVGEPSGDVHAANLIQQIRLRRGDTEFVGLGGPRMAEAGCRLDADTTKLAVMGFFYVFLNLHKFARLVSRADRYFRHERPDAVVLIDFPGFNWWIARRAKVHGIPVFYYLPPQIWGWASWRVKKMRKFVDHVLCNLPFEESWLKERGCNATFVGHPFFDEVREQHVDSRFMAVEGAKSGPLVTILPGSRTQEVTNNLQSFLKAAALVRDRVPDVRFAIASYRPNHARIARQMVESSGLEASVHVHRTAELIQMADCCMAVSGSVSLELLYHTRPTVVQYRINRFHNVMQRYLRKVRYITLVNLLAADELFPKDLTLYDPGQEDAEKVLFPEYLTCGDKSEQIAAHVIGWLTDRESRETLVRKLADLKEEVAHGGASGKAAEYIVSTLERRPGLMPKPHFLPGRVVASSDYDYQSPSSTS